MTTQFEKTGECLGTLTIEAEPAAIESAMKRAARHLAEHANIPGFRKGKAPYTVVVTQFGEQAVFDEAIEILGPELYRKALDEHSIEPARAGTLEEVVSREPLVMRFSVPLAPEIDPGAYREMRVAFEEPPVEQEQVERVLESLRQSQALLMPVDRPAATGDILLAKISANILTPDGKTEAIPVAGKGDNEGAVEVELNENLGGRFPGCGPKLEGIGAGESREVDFTYPDTFPVERLRSKPAHLQLHCLAVKERRVPEWGEEVVRAVSDKSTLDDLRVAVREALLAQARSEAEQGYAREVLDKMIAGGSVRFPQVLVQEEIERMLRTLESNLQREGATLEVYLKTRPGGREALEKEYEPQARERLVRGLFLGEVAEREGLQVSDEEIADRFRQTFAGMPGGSDEARSQQALKDPTLRRLFLEDLLNEKAVRRVVEIGQGRAPDPAPVPNPADKVEAATA
jgi:trigger factor